MRPSGGGPGTGSEGGVTRLSVGRLWRAAVVAALLAAGCTESKEKEGSGGGATSGEGATTTVEAEGCDPDEPVVPCLDAGGSLDPYLPDEPTPASGEPITLGMINQETGATGAFPELSRANLAALEFVNAELGGVDGRPLELTVCDTEFSPAGSQACAQQFVEEGAVAVLGGLDIFGTGIEVLEDNGIPYVGGIPISDASAKNPISFQFSGGSWGASLAFADYAAKELGAERVSIMFADFGPIREAAEYGERALEALGVDEVKMVPMPLAGADFDPLMTAANDIDPDAIFALTADTGCVPTFQSAANLGVTADIFITGGCAAPKIIDAAGTDIVEGRIFNTEGPVNPDAPLPDSAAYFAIMARYGEEGDAISAGTVSFRSFMDLYMAMREIGAENLTPQSIVDYLRAAKDVPSFNGHPYTCDGKQIAGLPAICAPQQILARWQGETLQQITDWLQISELVS